MRSLGIPYQVIGSTKFFDRREIKDLVSFMQVMINPAQEVALRRIINVPRRGIGIGTLGKLSDIALERNKSMFEILEDPFATANLAPSHRKALGEFVDLIHKYRDMFEGEPLDEALKSLIKELDYKEFLMKTESSPKVARIRQENVDELVESVANFQERHGLVGTGSKLEHWLSRMMLDGSSNSKDDENQEVVSLMTLHASKGLEFPEVYLMGFEEEILPHSRSMLPGEDGDIEEERRLAYVGITRAKEKMVLTSAHRRGRGQASRKRSPSRFLGEIPEEWLVQHLHTPGKPRVVKEKKTRRAYLDQMRAILFDE